MLTKFTVVTALNMCGNALNYNFLLIDGVRENYYAMDVRAQLYQDLPRPFLYNLRMSYD